MVLLFFIIIFIINLFFIISLKFSKINVIIINLLSIFTIF